MTDQTADAPEPTSTHTGDVPRNPEDPEKVVTAADRGESGGEANLGVEPAQTAEGDAAQSSADAGRAE